MDVRPDRHAMVRVQSAKMVLLRVNSVPNATETVHDQKVDHAMATVLVQKVLLVTANVVLKVARHAMEIVLVHHVTENDLLVLHADRVKVLLD